MWFWWLFSELCSWRKISDIMQIILCVYQVAVTFNSFIHSLILNLKFSTVNVQTKMWSKWNRLGVSLKINRRLSWWTLAITSSSLQILWRCVASPDHRRARRLPAHPHHSSFNHPFNSDRESTHVRSQERTMSKTQPCSPRVFRPAGDYIRTGNLMNVTEGECRCSGSWQKG